MLKYLQNYTRIARLPELEPDRDLISFANGVVRLSDITFTPSAEIVEGHPMAGATAYHYIPHEWTGSSDTPLLNRILDAPMSGTSAPSKIIQLYKGCYRRT